MNQSSKHTYFSAASYVGLILLTASLTYAKWPGEDLRVFILSGMLFLYNGVEAVWLWNTNRKWIIINPVILAVGANFMLYQGGVTNFFLIEPDGQYSINTTSSALWNEKIWLIKGMAYAIYASIAMWMGYKVVIGRKIAHGILYKLRYKELLGDNINFNLVILMAIIGYGLKLYLLSIGLYGRLTELEYSVTGEVSSFAHSQTRFFRYFSILPFTLICVHFFKFGGARYRNIFIITLTLEVFFAFIYGARSPIVMISLIVFFAYYYATRRLKIAAVLPLLFVVYIAFTVVQEFKEFAQATTTRQLSPIEVIDQFLAFRENLSDKKKELIYDQVQENVVRRMNFVSELGMALRYKEYGLDENDPDFLKALLMIPVDVVVPKFMQGKAKVSWGYWFKIDVLNRTLGLEYNIAFSAIGYLNFVGGVPAILIGFFLYGIMLKITYCFLEHGILGFMMFLVLMSTIYTLRTHVSGNFVNFIRYLVLIPWLLFFLFHNHHFKRAFSALIPRPAT